MCKFYLTLPTVQNLMKTNIRHNGTDTVYALQVALSSIAADFFVWIVTRVPEKRPGKAQTQVQTTGVSTAPHALCGISTSQLEE